MIPRDIPPSAVKIRGSTPEDVEYESVLEEDYLFLVRFDHQVESYQRYQGSIVWFTRDGEERSYGPDFEITYKQPKSGRRRRNLVVEVKPDFEPDPYSRKKNLPRRESAADNDRKWRAAEKQLALQGKEFRVVRAKEIETDYLENAKFLLMYRDHPFPLREASVFLDALAKRGRATMRQLLLDLTVDRQRRAELLPTLYALIAERKVVADLNRVLCFDTTLELP